MLLELSTWPEVEAYLEESRGIIVPVGSTEQHGPTGLLGTDFICAQTLARGVGEAAGAMVAPTITVGMSVHHLNFAGSMTLKPSTLVMVVRDCILSLARHGFEHFFFINGHGGNTPALKTAFSEVQAEMSARPVERVLRCKTVSWWESEAAQKINQELFGGREGRHATAGEISITQMVHPDLIKQAPLGPYSAKDEDFHGPVDFRRKYPDGRIASDPSLASPGNGEKIYRAVVPDLAGMYRAFLAQA